jgi:molybdopterin synthase catalytic subunit
VTALFEIRDTPLSVDECLAAVSHPGAGGIALFVGIVRGENAGKAVTRLEYEAYGSMAKKEMQRIGEAIAQEVPDVRLATLHRIGSLGVGEIAVICAASASHRDAAFKACRLLIDRIKEQLPIWKREHGPEGPHWVNWEDARTTTGK